MSLPKTIPDFVVPLGKADEAGNITVSREWYLFLQQLYLYTVAAGFKTSESVLTESAELDQGPIISFNGITGAQTATFTATNKPGTGTTAPDLWVAVPINGVVHYIPAWK